VQSPTTHIAFAGEAMLGRGVSWERADVYTVTPAHLRSAEAEQSRRAAILSAHPLAMHTRDDLATLAEHIETADKQLQAISTALTELAREQRLTVRIRTRLQHKLRFRQAILQPSTALVIVIGGITVSAAILALCGFLECWALGCLLCFVANCAMALVLVGRMSLHVTWSDEISVLTAAIEQHNAVIAENQEKREEARNQKERILAARHDVYGLYKRMDEALRIKERYEEVLQWCNRLRQLLGSRQYHLLQQNWNDMKGVEFEAFLKDVFQVLGYLVETTKASGDHGVDLVIEKGGTRIAVQVKRHAATIGNKAVQEAVAGRRLYNCHLCAVIATSGYSRGARRLADANGCALVSGHEIAFLIRGDVHLELRAKTQQTVL
jgi:HJR/Mrr/RecB family endonuclease